MGVYWVVLLVCLFGVENIARMVYNSKLIHKNEFGEEQLLRYS